MNNSRQRIVLAVGLTGGHIYPARALAEDLGSGNYEFLFVARTSSLLAKKLLEDEGFPVLGVKTRGLPRDVKGFILHGFCFFWQQTSSALLLLRAFKDWRPQLIVGLGGYVAFPAVLAAWALRIPRLVFEPNAKLGLANKILACVSSKVISTFDLKTRNSLIIRPPLRRSLYEALNLARDYCRDFFDLDRNMPCVLVFGGSQGARSINCAFREVVKRLREEGASFGFIHITGAASFKEFKNFYEKENLLKRRGVCLGYLEDMGKAYRAASVIISRAGAMTVLELLHFKIPAILIPLSHAAESHQLKNAQALEDLGLAQVIEEDSSLAERLYIALRKMLKDHGSEPPIPAKLKTASLRSFKDVVEEFLNKDVRKKDNTHHE